jgi:exo-beta-1,3-glucanase (GH17 family)
MKKLSIVVAAALLGASLTAQAVTRGFNYDPAHSSAFTTAQRNNNKAGMQAVIDADFAKMKRMGITTIKTFYSTFCTFAGQCVDVGAAAKKAELKVLLGVFEFQQTDFTAAQVTAAIQTTKANPGTIIGIVVGNEDMFTFNGIPIPTMQQRIANDMKQIKAAISSSVPVTTAQREPDWYSLKQLDPFKITEIVDVITANIYPFWGNSPEKVGNVSVATKIPGLVAALEKTFPNKPVQVGEEGWPSCGINPNTQDRTIAAESDYYGAWKTRASTDKFNSFYFAVFDNQTVTQCTPQQPVGDANNYFGLCTAAGAQKLPVNLINCSA